MRGRFVLALAVMLLLAGCQAAAGPGADATPSTVGASTAERPAGDATDRPSTVDPSTFPYPPGTSAEGLDPSVLPARHAEALVDARRYTFVQSQTAGNRTVTTRLDVDHGRQRLVGVRRAGVAEDGQVVDIYATGDTLYRRQSQRLTNGSSIGNYEEQSRDWSRQELTARSALTAVLETYQFDVESVRTRNDSRFVRYESTGPREPATRNAAPLPTNGTATVEVDDRGIVRRLVVEPDPERDDRLAIAFRNLTSVAVPRPAWVDAATGPPPVEVPTANLTANTTTVVLETAKATLETKAVWIHHEDGESLNASALDVTANRARAYDVRNRSTTNDTLTPVQPFADVGETFDPGESVRIVHTVPPHLYGGSVSIADGRLTMSGRDSNRSFPTLQDQRSLWTDQEILVLWNRSRPQTLLTYDVESPDANRTVTPED
jgi:hypothetical protein